MKIVFRCDPAIETILPKPVAARDCLPDWLREMPARAPSDFHGQEVRTLKQCPPFVDAIASGFLMLLPCDIEVDKGRFSWDWPLPPLTIDGHTRSPLSFHVAAQLVGSPFFEPECPAIKFNSFWTIELDEGYSLLVTHPINRPDQPFRLLTGLVDCDRFNDVGIFFPALWTKPDFVGRLTKGTPIAQCIAIHRESQELIFGSLSGERANAYVALTKEILKSPGVYRRRFRSKRPG
jgi:hypothetical protein